MTGMDLIDSHSHLFLEEFRDDLPQVMERARAAGISHIFMPNIDRSTIEALKQTCADYSGYCFPIMGLHPTSVNENYKEELQAIEKELQHPGYVAIGEIGMDLYWDRTYAKEQQTVFTTQVEWALELDLPVVIHCREAFEEILDLLRPYKDKPLRGIFHSFTGTADEAGRILQFPGFCIGINGIATFKKSSLVQVIPSIPLQRLVLETDSPYLAPVPCRGRRNESAFLPFILQKVAEVYGRPQEEVAAATSANALRVFGMAT